MSTTSDMRAWADRAVHLRADHEGFEERLETLSRTAHEGDWEDVDEIWGPFEKDFRAHMEFEERELFAGFAATGPDPADVVKTLREQHDDMREQLSQLGIEIQLHAIRAETIDAFVKAIRLHSTVESAHFYPWVDGQLEKAAEGAPKGQGSVRSL